MRIFALVLLLAGCGRSNYDCEQIASADPAPEPAMTICRILDDVESEE